MRKFAGRKDKASSFRRHHDVVVGVVVVVVVIADAKGIDRDAGIQCTVNTPINLGGR